MSQWRRLTAVFDPAPQDWGVIVDTFMRHGCAGVVEEDNPPRATSYLADSPEAEAMGTAIANDLASQGLIRFQSEVEPEQDWQAMWRDHFKARRVGDRFVIVPSWETFDPQPGDRVIHLDPGQAFGTGDHPTTRLCLRLMEPLGLEGKSVADIGCGTGVLAIGAWLLGASPIFASDLDPLSVIIANENFERNAAPLQATDHAGFAGLTAQVDVAVSNIISATLIRLAPEAARWIRPGGYWIISGIFESNWPDVLASATTSGFELVQVIEEEQWVGALLRR